MLPLVLQPRSWYLLALLMSYSLALTANLWLIPKTSASRSWFSSICFFFNSWSSRCLPRPLTMTTSSLLSKISAFTYGLKVQCWSSSISFYLLSAAIFIYFSFNFFFKFYENSSPLPPESVPGTSANFLDLLVWGWNVHYSSCSLRYWERFSSNFCFAAGLLLFSLIRSCLLS